MQSPGQRLGRLPSTHRTSDRHLVRIYSDSDWISGSGQQHCFDTGSINSFPRSRQDNAFSWTLKAIERTSPSERLINNRASLQRRPFALNAGFARGVSATCNLWRLERKRKRRVSPWSVDQREAQTLQGLSVSSITSSTPVTNQHQPRSFPLISCFQIDDNDDLHPLSPQRWTLDLFTATLADLRPRLDSHHHHQRRKGI